MHRQSDTSMFYPLSRLCVLVPEIINRARIKFGDVITFQTINSTYMVFVVDAKKFLVCGGYYERKGRAPSCVKIQGCTWNGSLLKLDVIAGQGQCVEFGDKVVTSPVRNLQISRATSLN